MCKGLSHRLIQYCPTQVGVGGEVESCQRGAPLVRIEN